MWLALRTELAYFRPWLLGGFGIAAGVVILLHVVLHFFGEGEGVPTFLPAMFPLLAGMVVSFIAQSYRFEERRVRLLMTGPLRPRQFGIVMVLLPVFLVGLGGLASVLVVALGSIAVISQEPTSTPMLGVLAGQFLVYALLGLLIQEAVVAQRQGRTRSAFAAWAGIVPVVPLIMVFYWFETQPAVFVTGYAIVAAIIMAATVALYQARTDFMS